MLGVWSSMWVLVIGFAGAASLPGDSPPSCTSEGTDFDELDDQSLLSLNVQKHMFQTTIVGAEFSGTEDSLVYGSKVVIAFSSDAGYTEESGWYGDKVGAINDFKVMQFGPGGDKPQSYFLRPKAGASPSGCIQYGGEVVIAESAQVDDSGRCGWYGCTVGQIVNALLQFTLGGKDPSSFFLVPGPDNSAVTGDCVKLNDQVVFASSADYQQGITDELYLDSDDQMAFGVEPSSVGFFLRQPADGPGPIDLCNSVNATMNAAASMILQKINAALISNANRTIKNTSYAWQTKPVEIFGVEIQNEAGRTVTASDFLNASVAASLNVSECVSTGGVNMSFGTTGSANMTWNDSVNVGVTFFYHGFIPFIKLSKPIGVKVEDVYITLDLAANWTTQSGEATELCLVEAVVSNCVTHGKSIVSGLPAFASDIQQKIDEKIDDYGNELCPNINAWLVDFVPYCLAI